MLYRDRKLFDGAFWGGVGRIISVTGFSVIAGYIMISIYPLGAADRGIVTLGSKLIIISVVTIGVHVGISSLFGLEEVRPLLYRLKRIVLKPVKIDY